MANAILCVLVVLHLNVIREAFQETRVWSVSRTVNLFWLLQCCDNNALSSAIGKKRRKQSLHKPFSTVKQLLLTCSSGIICLPVGTLKTVEIPFSFSFSLTLVLDSSKPAYCHLGKAVLPFKLASSHRTTRPRQGGSLSLVGF